MSLSRLECLVPPPIVMLITAGLMWLAARHGRGNVLSLTMGFAQQGGLATTIAVAVGGVGIIIAVMAAVAFRHASTTINPMNPSAAAHLITTGVFRLSRNPIYLADALILLAFAIYLNSLFAVLLVIGFVRYINRLQIQPEERALTEKFGNDYTAYRARVRRWL